MSAAAPLQAPILMRPTGLLPTTGIPQPERLATAPHPNALLADFGADVRGKGCEDALVSLLGAIAMQGIDVPGQPRVEIDVTRDAARAESPAARGRPQGRGGADGSGGRTRSCSTSSDQ